MDRFTKVEDWGIYKLTFRELSIMDEVQIASRVAELTGNAPNMPGTPGGTACAIAERVATLQIAVAHIARADNMPLTDEDKGLLEVFPTQLKWKQVEELWGLWGAFVAPFRDADNGRSD
ncbi:MAG: hypothetical protein KAW17_09725 [Candidatus Eisenbacteria sp.]|nr:hypothetical protein [Candidatus Eisenbacteria bacterium]